MYHLFRSMYCINVKMFVAQNTVWTLFCIAIFSTLCHPVEVLTSRATVYNVFMSRLMFRIMSSASMCMGTHVYVHKNVCDAVHTPANCKCFVHTSH